MTFRIIFQIVKKTLKYFFFFWKTKIEIVLSVGGAVATGSLTGCGSQRDFAEHIGVLIMTFYWFFALSLGKVLLSLL